MLLVAPKNREILEPEHRARNAVKFAITRKKLAVFLLA